MSAIEIALLASVAHRTDLHRRWAQLIAHATPTGNATKSCVAVASPRRTTIKTLA